MLFVSVDRDSTRNQLDDSSCPENVHAWNGPSPLSGRASGHSQPAVLKSAHNPKRL